MIEPHKNKARLNLKIAQGQISFIEKMVDKNRPCGDIAQQINAAIGILVKVNSHVLESHLSTCMADILNSKKTAEKARFIKELVYNFKITNK